MEIKNPSPPVRQLPLRPAFALLLGVFPPALTAFLSFRARADQAQMRKLV